MNILGIHIGHDSSACLVRDGQIVADVAEERFARVKHCSGPPLLSVAYCLESQGLTMKDIDVVAIPSLAPVSALNEMLVLKGARREKRSFAGRMEDRARRLLKRATPKPPIYVRNFPLPDSVPLVHVEHHLAHAASAYYTSGSAEKQLIVTMDGSGDGICIGLWRGENGRIEPLQRFPNEASLGYFYSNVTEALGWWHGDGEGKTMGLAPYGDPDKARGVLDRLYPKFSDGRLVEPIQFRGPYTWHQGGAMQWHFDDAYDIQALVQKYGREHIAAEAQRVLEDQSKELIFPWLEREKTRNLTCAGGIFLNVKLNQRLWESGRVDHHWIYPNAGDSGLAVGAALYVYHQMNPGRPIGTIDNLYWGPEYSEKEIEAVLKLRQLTYHRVDNVEEFAARQLADNKIVAWFQGRMESGPRALGNRSILMSSNRKENKDIINARVKFREAFRPFCPSLLWEHRHDYLERGRDEFFMITSFTCKGAKRDKVPAVVHADATLRPQTVQKSFNPRYWTLINEFGKLTGEPLLLNTSLNIMSEPVIAHPREAIRCFYDNGLDVLVMGNFVLTKDKR
ncbi:MAG TPA: carbamoyltransferase C-terminal domain-containing protein [Verrucomicrobiae bacterium]|nr:carbamoyltransferase C-terminal domain-containing protein [Verrucomicrobiae bacterium]